MSNIFVETPSCMQHLFHGMKLLALHEYTTSSSFFNVNTCRYLTYANICAPVCRTAHTQKNEKTPTC